MIREITRELRLNHPNGGDEASFERHVEAVIETAIDSCERQGQVISVVRKRDGDDIDLIVTVDDSWVCDQCHGRLDDDWHALTHIQWLRGNGESRE